MAGWKKWPKKTPACIPIGSRRPANRCSNGSCYRGERRSVRPISCWAMRGSGRCTNLQSRVVSERRFSCFDSCIYIFLDSRKDRTMTLPIPGMVIEQRRTALVFTDLQNDFLNPGGAAWGLIKESLATNRTVQNIEALLRAAAEGG